MLKKINIIIIGLSLLYNPLKSEEIYNNKESITSSIQVVTEEMKNLNSNLELLSNTISNLVP